MKATVVILLSDKRSGSTIFQKELCRHPLVNHVDYSPHRHYETHHWLKAAVITKYVNHKGYGSIKNAKQYIIDCIRKNVPDFIIPKQGLIIDGWEALCKRFANPIFFEKSPQSLAHWGALLLLLRWIKQTEYNVKIIGLVRNPMAVMYSAYKLFFTEPEKRQFTWAKSYRNLLSFKEMLDSNQSYLVRYEDLAKDPKKTFKEACDFIGIKYNKEMGKNFHSNSLNKWANDPNFTLQLHPIVAQMAEHFGYDKEDIYNPPKQKRRFSRVKHKLKGTIKLTRARIADRIIKPKLLKLK